MRSRAALLASQCRPRAVALPASEVAAQLSVLSDWKLERGAIARSFLFRDYHETIAFVNALAWVAHAADHHPDLAVGYDRCEVRFSTHSVGGISDNDFICAAEADAIYARRAASPSP